MNIPSDNTPHVECRRRDRLTAQRIEVGLVLLEMLGAPDATDYLAQNKVPADVADRVLVDGGARRAAIDP